MSESKDRIRSKTIGRQATTVKKIFKYYPPIYSNTVEDGKVVGVTLSGHEEEAVEVEFRRPTIKQRSDIIKTCRRPDGSFDETEFLVQACIQFVYDPETGEHVFEKTDVDVLREQPAGDFVDQFGTEAIALMNIVDADVKKST
jgi:hypothetical protein